MIEKVKSDIPAYILAGGDSIRFGENKALYIYRGMPLIMHLINSVEPLVSSLNIVSKSKSDFSDLNIPVLEDSLNIQTPLAGILRGLEDADGWGLFLACDMPFLNRDIIISLLDAIDDTSEEDISAVVASSPRGVLQPMVACYHSSGIPALKLSIENNKSVKGWLEVSRIKTVSFDDEEPFRNVNRKSELEDSTDQEIESKSHRNF
ncbi:MAG: molybdenum cofactor guanylyltransferase [Candidatus Marinimicrobia bacterium]|nr:molybdenum cofactor guanylyltransferase [Candidatus Neomarinimicrobiota bacterium]